MAYPVASAHRTCASNRSLVYRAVPLWCHTREQHIEELRTELRNAINLEERQQIVAELATAVAELDVLLENMVPD
jgi:hypothetical protein